MIPTASNLIRLLFAPRISAPLALLVITTAANADVFDSGVAVGDLTSRSAVFWTRATGVASVVLDIATDPDFVDNKRSIESSVSAERDSCVKIDVGELAPATRYYYRFRAPVLVPPNESVALAGAVSSPLGTFATFPADDSPAALRFLFTGDSNYAVAPFVAFGAAANENADLLIWFGDTIYGDVTAGGLGPAQTLAEYRAKYAQVRSDANVRAALAAFPVIVGADDHEVFNDYAGQDPSVPRAQIDAGYQAFFDWMPIREQNIAGDAKRQYRRIRYGANVEFFVLDGRQYRETSLEAECAGALDPEGFLLGPLGKDASCIDKLNDARTMLGAEQLAWLKGGLLTSSAKVKFVVNNVPMSYLGIFPYDRWDGYDAERRDLLHFIDANAIDGVVILTTDIHANAYNPDIGRFFRQNRPEYGLRGRVAVPELIVGPIGNFTARQSVDDVVEALVGGRGSGPLADFGEGVFFDRLRAADGLTFLDPNQLGYVVVDVSSAGDVNFTYRGITPERVAAGETAASDFAAGNVSTLAPAVCGPCGAPFALAGAGVAGAWFVRRRSAR